MNDDQPKVREYTKEEIARRQLERRGKHEKKATIAILTAVPKRKRHRAKTKFRYCVSLSPRTVLFLRTEYGGEEHSLSLGIESGAKALYNLTMESFKTKPRKKAKLGER